MTDESFVDASRREFVAALSAVAGSAALAGCAGDVTDQEFEADPVGLDDEGLQGLAMEEVSAQSDTQTREGGAAGVEGEISITSYLGAYSRSLDLVDEQSGYRPTLMDSFVRAYDSRAGVIAGPHNDFPEGGLPEGVTYRPFETEIAVDKTQLGFLAPNGARAGGSVTANELLALGYPAGLPEEVTLARPITYLAPPEAVFPAGVVPAGWSDWASVNEAALETIPGIGSKADELDPAAFVEDGRVLVVGESMPGIEELAERDDVRAVEAGETISTEQTVLAGPLGGLVAYPQGWSDWATPEVYGGAPPIPFGGVGFGLGVLSTPNAELNGESVNPLAEMENEELLNSDRMSGMLDVPYFETAEGGVDVVREFGVVPAGWSDKRGVVPAGWSDKRGEVLGEEAPFRTFAGVVEDDHGPWLTVTHVARASPDDLVVVVGTHATPLGTVPSEDWEPGSSVGPESWPMWYLSASGRLFSVDSTPRLGTMPPQNWE
jgi:hypothetical protein